MRELGDGFKFAVVVEALSRLPWLEDHLNCPDLRNLAIVVGNACFLPYSPIRALAEMGLDLPLLLVPDAPAA